MLTVTQEVYLLQTRLQKMPYKHIAAHLKKTELACRLHYHQLSHGSNRRKRTTSMSSSGSSTHSPIMHANIPSPIHEHTPSRSVSPPGSMGGYGNPSSPGGVQLPSIMNTAGGAGNNNNSSPRLPAILPKPANMSMVSRYSSLQDHSPHGTPILPSSGYASAASPAPSNTGNGMGPLRLDCSALPPMPQQQQQQQQPASAVDMGRLHAAYSAHRMAFWSAVATEYGHGAHPSVLEQAWRSGNPVMHHHNNGVVSGYGTHTPITPVGSPDERDLYGNKADKTRISSILGIDANPRSPKEREMVRRMEEERVMVGVGA